MLQLPARRGRVLVASRHGRLAKALLLSFCVLMLTVATTVELALGDDVIPTSLSTSTSTSTTTTSCGGVRLCLNDPQCARCLLAINETRSFIHTQAEFFSISFAGLRAYDVGFFETLLSTASCSTNITPPAILRPALQELSASPCMEVYGMTIGDCAYVEYVTVHVSLILLYPKRP